MKTDQFLTAPYSAEAEASVLSALLLDNEALHRVPDLTADDFYTERYADVFRAIQSLAATGKPADIVTVFEQLQQTGKPQSLADLHALAQFVPSASNLRRYAEIVKGKHQSRALMKAAAEINDLAMQPGTAAEQIDAAQMLLAKLATVKSKREPQHINASLADYLALLTDLSEGKNPAISTGINGLDKLLNGGMRRGEMMVIGARQSMGRRLSRCKWHATWPATMPCCSSARKCPSCSSCTATRPPWGLLTWAAFCAPMPATKACGPA